jgi:hypothetical protein
MVLRSIDIPSLESMLSNVFLCPGFSCMITIVPGGTTGVALKSTDPSNCSYVDSFGLIRDALMRFNVVSACGSNLHHKEIGQYRSVDANPAMKWSLNVLIELYDAFCQWM